MEYYVYKFIGKNNEVLYVGQTIDMDRRMSEHKGKQWDLEKDHIEYARCKNQCDMCIYEMYYINKLEAKYNDSITYGVKPTFELPELEFKIYDCSIIEQKHLEVIEKSRNTFEDNFNPEKYWERKKNTLEDKIKEYAKESEEYKKIAKQIEQCNEMMTL